MEQYGKKRRLKPEEKPAESGFVAELKQMASDVASGFTGDTLENVKKDKERNRRRLGR